MKKGIQLLIVAVSSNIFLCTAQNVGIGTATPLHDLHITKEAGNARILLNTNGAGASSALHLSTGGDLAEVTKWSLDASGTVAGLPVAGMARLWNSNAGLLTGTGGAHPLHFATQNMERMRINADGQLFYNTTAAIGPFEYQLNII